MIIASPAARARATVQAAMKAAKVELKVTFDESIYGASSAELMKLIRRLPTRTSARCWSGITPVSKTWSGD